tara:strand:+ start:20227 stop:20457 length:231 start_codon:yes stop_codon:yes gene_type:complete
MKKSPIGTIVAHPVMTMRQARRTSEEENARRQKRAWPRSGSKTLWMSGVKNTHSVKKNSLQNVFRLTDARKDNTVP